MVELARTWTREEVLALPEDGNRYELVDGELLVTPGPRPAHQLAVSRLLVRLLPYLEATRLGIILTSPSDLDLGSGQLVQPDLFVVPLPPGAGMTQWTEVGVPPLVIEIVSPSTARFDRIVKRRLFQRSGVPVYWIVDLDARLVEVWTPSDAAPTIVDEILTWHPSTGAPPLEIDLTRLFREIRGS